MVQPVEVEPVDGDPLATIGQRIMARVVDWLLLFAVIVPIGLLSVSGDPDERAPLWAVLTSIAVVFGYETLCIAWRGQTAGKAIVGIEIVRLSDGERPGMIAAASRVVPVVALLVLLQQYAYVALVFVYFSAAFMAHQRGVLDRIAGTVVIRARRSGGLLGGTALGA